MPRDMRFLVVAGSYEEYRHWLGSASPAVFRYISSAQQLKGLGPSVLVKVGNWSKGHEPSLWDEIKIQSKMGRLKMCTREDMDAFQEHLWKQVEGQIPASWRSG